MYKVISLFSGIGGSSLGYKMAGLKVIASNEFIDYQAKNYRLNHKDVKIYKKDIRLLNPKDVIKDLNLKEGELDVLDGSPPCASFSISGKREKLWGKEKKYSNRKQRTDDLFFEYNRFLKIIQPKVFVAENVKGLILGKAKGYFRNILIEMKNCGYNVKVKLMNAKYYNVPQSRERLIFIGVRNDLNIQPSFPKANKKIVPVKKAFENINNKTFSNVKLTKRTIQLLENTQQGEDLSKGCKRLYNKNNYYTHRKLSFNKVSPCILQTIGSPIYHPIEKRRLTIEELKRLTTFPDDYKLEGTYNQKWEGCARAVPPLMMKAVAENIKINILDKYYNEVKNK